MSHLTEDDLTLLHYTELTDAEMRAAQAHLESCAACRHEQAKLRRIFSAVDTYTTPEPASRFEADVWRRLQPALRAAREPGGSRFMERVREWLVPSRGVALGGAMVALVVVAFVIGRYWQLHHETAPAVETAQLGAASVPGIRLKTAAISGALSRTRIWTCPSR